MRGSIATTAPRRSPSASVAACCSRDVELQRQVLPAHRRLDVEHLANASARVGLHLLIADLTVQRSLVHAFDAELADELRRAVADRVEHLEIVFTDAPHRADRVPHQTAERVMAHELRFDDDAWQAEAVHRQRRDLFFRQHHLQRHRFERPAPSFETFLERVDVAVVELDELVQFRQHAVEIGDLFGDQRRARTPAGCRRAARRCDRRSGRAADRSAAPESGSGPRGCDIFRSRRPADGSSARCSTKIASSASRNNAITRLVKSRCSRFGSFMWDEATIFYRDSKSAGVHSRPFYSR